MTTSAARPTTSFQSLPKLSRVRPLVAFEHRLGGIPASQGARHLERLIHQSLANFRLSECHAAKLPRSSSVRRAEDEFAGAVSEPSRSRCRRRGRVRGNRSAIRPRSVSGHGENMISGSIGMSTSHNPAASGSNRLCRRLKSVTNRNPVLRDGHGTGTMGGSR